MNQDSRRILEDVLTKEDVPEAERQAIITSFFSLL